MRMGSRGSLTPDQISVTSPELIQSTMGGVHFLWVRYP